MFKKSTCNIDWLSRILSISRLRFKHVIKYFVALGMPSKRRQLPEEQNKPGKLSQIEGAAPKAVPQTQSLPSHIEHHSLLSPVTNKFIFKHTLFYWLNPDVSKADGGLEAHSAFCLPIFMMCLSSFCLKPPLHHTFFLSQSQEHPALLLCLWTSGTFFALNKLMIRNAVLDWMLVHTSGKKCTGKSHILECCLVAVQHCRNKRTSAHIIHYSWRVTQCLNSFWSEAPHNWPANLLGAKAIPSVSTTPSNSLPPTLSLAGASKSLPLFAFSIHRGWRNSVDRGAKSWEASFLLGLSHLVLHRHQVIKKEQFGCQVGGWLLFTGNGMVSHAQSSRRLQRLQKKQ